MKLNKRLSIVSLIFVVSAVTIGHLAVKRLHRGIVNRYTDVVMRTRVEKLNQMCNRLGKRGYELQDIWKSGFKHIIVDDKYKVMFCYVPKVACTNFLRVFLSLSDNIKGPNPLYLEGRYVHISKKNLTYLATFSNTEIEYRIKYYKNVIFVREPLERVFSAFRNKFILTQNPDFTKCIGKKIIQRSRSNTSKKSLDEYGVKFTEFVRYLLHWKTITHGYNEHWDSFSNLCHPCLIRYNYIGKYESFEKDIAGFLKLLSIEGKLQLPKREEYYKHVKSADVMSTYFKELQPELFEYLIKIYTEDYVLFDYEIPSRKHITKGRL